MRLGLVLLPEPTVSQRCVEYADEITALAGRRSILGPGALPHISLVHVETDVDPEAAWTQCIHALPDACTVSIGGLVFFPYIRPPASPGVAIRLAVDTSEPLRDMERRSLSLPWVVDGVVTTRNHDRFQPHITLGITDGTVSGQPPLPIDLLDRAGVRAVLALGPIGPRGVLQEVLLSA